MPTTNPPSAHLEHHTFDVPLAYYEWLAGIEADVRVRDLTPVEISSLALAFRDAPKPAPEHHELRETIGLISVSGSLFEHVSGKYGVRWQAINRQDEYAFRGDAMSVLSKLRADAILALISNPSRDTSELVDGTNYV